jgi:ABC-type dipeptide/oligopeptide/nickel transport system permease component
LTVPTLLGVSILVFLLGELAPGDPAVTALGIDYEAGTAIAEEQLQAVRERLGLDRPAIVRFGDWLAGFVTGDLGRSIANPAQEVSDIMRNALPTTLILTFGTMAIAVVVGMSLGILSAVYRDTPLDYAARVLAIVGTATPTFWFAMLLLLVFAFIWPILPLGGALQDKGFEAMILPIMAVALHPAALITRLTRAGMIDVLGEDYIRTARAKGLRGPAVVFSHGLRNALIPIVTVVGFQLGGIMGGTVAVEAVFSLRGLGKVLLDAIHEKDLFVAQGAVLTIAAIYVFANLLVDLLYYVIDPRLRGRNG